MDNVLILQGGGALGAYQAGVYQHLHEHHQPIDWVIGTSIGAINSALIAGNQPERRVDRLREFWHSLTPDSSPGSKLWPTLFPWLPQPPSINTMGTMLTGVYGFFKPRPGAAWDIDAKVPLEQAGFYDTTPLKHTLEKYVDFDYLNSGDMRISVCAVDLDDGQSTVFDSTERRIEPEHIMASGALPPGFPPILIDGRAYWDGGVYSNSPLEIFLENNEKRDALCFMVDLWDPTEARPQSISEALTRYKSIQYSNRSREQLATHQRLQDLQKAIRELAKHVPAETLKRKEIKALANLGCDHTINVVNLIMKAFPGEQYFRDIDFSLDMVDKRWQAGTHDCKRALRHKGWLQPLPPHAGLVIHELPQEE